MFSLSTDIPFIHGRARNQFGGYIIICGARSLTEGGKLALEWKEERKQL